jgi:hypothetical protein
MGIEYSIIEWLWEDSSIRVNLPGNEEKLYQGSYMEIVEVLNRLGKEGWQTSTCTSGSNWILWTLIKTVVPGQAPK